MSEVEHVPLGDGGAFPVLASEEAICLFAFVECAGALEPPRPDEALERRLMLIPMGSVAALIGVVPLADYCGADAERRLADIAWLAPRVRRHGELVEWATQQSPVFPVPFATLYSSFASLTTFLQTHEATIADFLSAVAGKEEWELRGAAQFDRPEVLDQLACSAWPEWRELPKGARYMRLCRDRNALLDFGRVEAATLLRDCIAELQPLTAGVRQQGVLRWPNSGGTEVVARYSLLVAKTDVAAVRRRAEEIAVRAARQHVAITLSGPWPPFSFRPDLVSPH